MSDGLSLAFTQLNARISDLLEDAREIREKTDRIPAIEEHLRTLNGSVARHELQIAANRKAHEEDAAKIRHQLLQGDEESARLIQVVAQAVDGFELREKLQAERERGQADVYSIPIRIFRWLQKDSTVLKLGLTLIGTAVGVDLVSRFGGLF